MRALTTLAEFSRVQRGQVSVVGQLHPPSRRRPGTLARLTRRFRGTFTTRRIRFLDNAPRQGATLRTIPRVGSPSDLFSRARARVPEDRESHDGTRTSAGAKRYTSNAPSRLRPVPRLFGRVRFRATDPRAPRRFQNVGGILELIRLFAEDQIHSSNYSSRLFLELDARRDTCTLIDAKRNPDDIFSWLSPWFRSAPRGRSISRFRDILTCSRHLAPRWRPKNDNFERRFHRCLAKIGKNRELRVAHEHHYRARTDSVDFVKPRACSVSRHRSHLSAISKCIFVFVDLIFAVAAKRSPPRLHISYMKKSVIN